MDTISARPLKLAAPVIVPSVTYLMNLSLQTGEVPTEFKRAKVTPIYKDGPDDEVENYMPMSVLSVISKLLERILHDQLYTFLQDHSLLSNRQSEFRPNYSTTSAFTYVSDQILEATNTGKLTGVIYLDLKKGF